MVMPQVPALFLPKKKVEEKPQVKNTNKNKKKKRNFDKKVSVLFQGRIDGNKKNNSQVCSGTITG